MAPWSNGKASDCKSEVPSSILGGASMLPWSKWKGHPASTRVGAGSSPVGSFVEVDSKCSFLWYTGRMPANWDRVSVCAGYEAVHFPDHHRAWGTGYVHTHIVVAEQKLGRPLLSGEVVHHKDGDKRNNSPDNIEVFGSHRDHARLHQSEKPSSLVTLLCSCCGKEFARIKSRTPEAKGCSQAFCSRHCAGTVNGYQERPINHGTGTGYRRGCRCAKCRKAHADKMSAYRARKRSKRMASSSKG